MVLYCYVIANNILSCSPNIARGETHRLIRLVLVAKALK